MATLHIAQDIREALDAKRITWGEAGQETEGRRDAKRIERKLERALQKVKEIENELFDSLAERAHIAGKMVSGVDAEGEMPYDAVVERGMSRLLAHHNVGVFVDDWKVEGGIVRRVQPENEPLPEESL